MGKYSIYILTLISLSVFFLTKEIKAQDSSAHHLKELVVTGQYFPQSLKSCVYKMKVISAKQIRLRCATNVQGILSNEAGIRFSTDYTLGETDISMMGLSGQNVKILLDGIPLSDRGSAKQSLTQIDINNIERIEIVEGPMSTVYGTDALAGVINIITKKIFDKNNLSINAKIQEESVGNTYSPFKNEGVHNETAGVNWSNNNWRFGGSVTRNNFGGYDDTATYPAKVSKPKNQLMTSSVAGFKNKSLNVWYKLDYLRENIHNAGAININTGKAVDRYFITNRQTHELQGDWQIKSRLKFNNAFSYQNYRRNTETFNVDYTSQTKAPSTELGQWDATNFKTLFCRSTLYWYASPKFSLQPGLEVKEDKTSGERVAGNPSITDYSFFVTSEYKPFENISIKPGIRVSKNSVYDAPPVIPSINTRIALSKNFDFRFSYARGFRAPILRELYFSFHDSNHDIDGNPNLKAETSNSFIASLSWQKDSAVSSSNISATISTFYNDIRNRIDLAQSGGSSTLYSYINIRRYKSIGAAFSSIFNAGKRLSANSCVSFTGYYNEYNDFSASGNHSKFAWTPELSLNVTYSIPVINTQAGIFYKFNGALPSYHIESNNIYVSKIASYHWADITFSKQIFTGITAQAGIKNLLNVTRINNSSLDAGAHSTGGPVLIGYGRSYLVAISYQWSKKHSSLKNKKS